MKILFIGDISGRSGRKVIKTLLPSYKDKYKPDIIIANCENAAGGLGVSKEVIDELSAYGIDFFTSGDHVWYMKDFIPYLQDKDLPLVRPYNYEQTDILPGKGYDLLDLGKKGKLLIVNLLGQAFIRDHARSPFWAMDELLSKFSGEEYKDLNIFVDFHAETTAEKLCLGGYLKNRVAAVVGTHTHVATADSRLMGDTAYVTDVGMVGPLDASLWIKFENAIHNFKYPYKMPPTIEEEGKMVFNAVLIEVEKGKAKNINRVDKYINP